MVLAVAELALAALDQQPVTVARIGVVSELVGEPVGLPVGRAGVEEQQVDLEVEQVGDLEEDALLHAAERAVEAVHGPVAGVLGHLGEAVDERALGDPSAAGQLRQRLDRQPVGDHREDRALDRLGVDAPAADRRADRLADPEPLPQPVSHPARPHRPAVQQPDLAGGGQRDRVGRIEEAADRAHQPPQRLAVDLVGASEAMDDLGARRAGLGVAHVVRQRQVGDLAAVGVATLRLTHVHTPTPLPLIPPAVK